MVVYVASLYFQLVRWESCIMFQFITIATFVVKQSVKVRGPLGIHVFPGGLSADPGSGWYTLPTLWWQPTPAYCVLSQFSEY